MRAEETDAVAIKKQLRRKVLAMRDNLSPSDRARYDAQIAANVIDRSEYREAQAVLAYASYRSEVGTSALIGHALADGKAVFAPKVSGEEMVFYQLASQENLREGYRGIPEPEEGVSFPRWIMRQMKVPADAYKTEDSNADMYPEDGVRVIRVLMWMPGAVFDKDRRRIGYGKGFYDRYLEHMHRWQREFSQGNADTKLVLTTAALAYRCQVLGQIPDKPHDIRPDMVITETGIYSSGQEEG